MINGKDALGNCYVETSLQDATHILFPEKTNVNSDYNNVVMPIVEKISDTRVKLYTMKGKGIPNVNDVFDYFLGSAGQIYCVLGTPDAPTKDDIIKHLKLC